MYERQCVLFRLATYGSLVHWCPKDSTVCLRQTVTDVTLGDRLCPKDNTLYLDLLNTIHWFIGVQKTVQSVLDCY